MKKAFFWLSLLALTALSLMPTHLLPPQAFSLWDKSQHAMGFAGLMALGLLAYPQHVRVLPWLLLAHGGLIEMAQAASGWRRGDWSDLLADAIGIALISVFWLIAAGRSRPPH